MTAVTRQQQQKQQEQGSNLRTRLAVKYRRVTTSIVKLVPSPTGCRTQHRASIDHCRDGEGPNARENSSANAWLIGDTPPRI